MEITPSSLDSYRQHIALLKEAKATQERIVATAGALSPEYDKATAQVEYLKTLLEQSTGETANMGNVLTQLPPIAERLAAATRRTNFGGAVSEAQQLAHWLNISLSTAMALSRTTPAMADEDALMAQPVIPDAEAREGQRAAIENFKRLTKASGSAAKAISETAKEVKRLNEEAAKGRTPMQKYASEIEKLNDLKKNGLSDAAYSVELEKLNDSLADSLPMVNDVADAWADFVVGGFKDFKGFVDSVLSSFKKMLADMISTAARNTIMLSLGVTGGGTSGGGLLSGLTGGGGGLLSGLTGGGGGLLKGALGGFGKTGGILGMGGLGGGTGFLGGLGNAVSGGLGGIFKIGSAASAAGGGLMASLGAAVPVIGAVAAAVSFFKKKTTELDSGIMGTVSGMDAAIKSFRTIETKRFWGLSKRKSTSTEDLSGGPMADAIADMQRGIMDTAKTLGFGADAFKGFSHSFNLSLKGLSEDEKARKIAEEIQAMGDAFAGMIPHVSNVNELVAAASQRYDLQTRLLQAQGNESALLARSRKAELDATNALNHGLLRQIWAAEDLAKAQAEAARVAEEAARAAEEAARLEKERQSKLDESIYSVGRTRFEAEMLVAARRRGEVTLNRASQGLSQTQDLVRLDAVEQNTGENTKLMRKLVNYFEGWDVNGIPLET